MNQVRSRLAKFRHVRLGTLGKERVSQHVAYWIPSEQGQFKMKVAGTVFSERGWSGIGAVVHDCHVEF